MSGNYSLFREYEIENIIRSYLQSQGIRVDRKKYHGADIQGEDQSGRHYVVEVEGNQKPDGRPLDKRQKYTHFHRAFGQICSRLNDDSTVYALGLPFEADYIEYVHATNIARRKLDLRLYFVDNERSVITISILRRKFGGSNRKLATYSGLTVPDQTSKGGLWF